MKEMYLVIETGYEGIEHLCWLTDKPDEAVAKKAEFIEKKIQEEKEIFADDELREEPRDIADFFCIQKWDGVEFDCVCDKLGVPPKKLMLR